MDDWSTITKQRLKEMLQAAGTSLEVAAALYHEDAEQAFLENYANVDASTLYDGDSDDFEYWDDIEAFTLFMTGVNMHVLSELIFLGGDNRGPYNQVPKCTDWFEKALAWPDRDFRHEFRCVKCLSAVMYTHKSTKSQRQPPNI